MKQLYICDHAKECQSKKCFHRKKHNVGRGDCDQWADLCPMSSNANGDHYVRCVPAEPSETEKETKKEGK